MDSNTQDFDEYCEEMLPRLIAFGIRITRDQHEAEDVAIEALARTMLRWGRISSETWRDAWVFRVAVNLSIDVLRKRQRVTSLQDIEVSSDDAMPEPPVNLDDVLSPTSASARSRGPPLLRRFDLRGHWAPTTHLRRISEDAPAPRHEVASSPVRSKLVKDQRMAQPEEPMLTRPIDAMVTDIHHRAAALHRRRFRAAALACVGCLAVASAGVLALVDSTPSSPIKSPTSSARDAQLARYQQLVQETAEAKAGPTPQPPNQPVASGWSALEPSLPKSVPPEWSPLVISALQVLEYETHNDQAATLTLVQSQSPVQVQMSQGAVQVRHTLCLCERRRVRRLDDGRHIGCALQ